MSAIKVTANENLHATARRRGSVVSGPNRFAAISLSPCVSERREPSKRGFSLTRRSQRVASVALLLSLFLLSCARKPETEPPRFTDARPQDALEVHLVFDEAADLDLFVTDPNQEAVYFGNNPSLGGGILDRDQRCDATGLRREIIRFANPASGRYRVGVSYDGSCHFRRARATYEIRVRGLDLMLDIHGEIAPATFDPIALEFELD